MIKMNLRNTWALSYYKSTYRYTGPQPSGKGPSPGKFSWSHYTSKSNFMCGKGDKTGIPAYPLFGVSPQNRTLAVKNR